MYQYVGRRFTSKYLLPDTLYDIQAGEKCIRLRPYNGSKNFGYLRWNNRQIVPQGIIIPTKIKSRTGIQDKAYVIQINDTFYLLHPSFSGNPENIPMDTYPCFSFKKTPKNDFFEEAKNAELTKMIYPKYDRNLDFPKEFKKNLGIKTEYTAIVSVFKNNGRKWIEIRIDSPQSTKYIPLNDRIEKNCYVDALNGLTYLTKDKGHGLPLTAKLMGVFQGDDFVCWYSKVRDAIIVEEAPEKCAICGEQVRSIDPAHHQIQVCHTCVPYLGQNNLIDGLVSTYQTIEKTNETIKQVKNAMEM